MKDRKLSDGRLEELLDIFFPGGYSCSNRNDSYYAWYLGWLNILGKPDISFPCEVNLDAGGSAIVFHWYDKTEEVTDDQITAYIAGLMGMLEPDMQLFAHDSGDTTIQFMYKEY